MDLPQQTRLPVSVPHLERRRPLPRLLRDPASLALLVVVSRLVFRAPQRALEDLDPHSAVSRLQEASVAHRPSLARQEHSPAEEVLVC